MTYHYAMTGTACAAVYREIGGELVLQFYVDGNKHSGEFCDIAAIARATVAALNGTTAEPRVVWHPKAVEALRAADKQASGRYGDSPESDEAEHLMKPDARAAWRIIREALALVDQPPAEKVVGYSIIRDGGVAWTLLGKTIADARRVARKDDLVARLVEEPEA